MIKRLKTGLAVMLAAFVVFTTGCAASPQESNEPAQPAATETAQTQEAPKPVDNQPSSSAPQTPKTVTDAAGREVEIPAHLDTVAITCNGGSHHEVAILGAADKVIAMPDASTFPQLLKMIETYDDVEDAGSFDNVNIEEMVTLDPDFIFVGISSKETNEKLGEMGFPYYTLYIGWANIDTLKQEFLNVGAILGNEEKAQELYDYWTEKIAMVQDTVAKIPDSERKTVYYISKDNITSANTGTWTWPLIETSGGICTVPSGWNGEIDVETVLSWNPDVIILHSGSKTEEIFSDERITKIPAIANNEVYVAPTGGFWWDRPSPEAPLAFMWLAKTLYPEYTENIDLKAETKDFFARFYDYDLPDAEYEAFFPQ